MSQRDIHSRPAQEQEQEWRIVKETVRSVAPGVKQISQQLTQCDLEESAQLLEIDTLAEEIRVEPVSSEGKVVRLETVGNLLLELEREGKRCIAGFNGDFFSYVGVPSGLQIVNGELVTSPSFTKVLLAIGQDGSASLEDSVRMEAELRSESGYVLQIDTINRLRKAADTDRACLYTWRYGDSTRSAEEGLEVTIAFPASPVRLYPMRPSGIGIVQSMKEGLDTPIEQGTVVLSLTGIKARSFREQVSPGQRVTLHVTVDKRIRDAKQVISGNSTLACVLLKKGIVPEFLFDRTNRLYSDRHPRTAVAIKQGKLYMIAVDGRQPGSSDGMTLAELAGYLQALGMEDAINLDGGGSTTCYIRQPGDAKATLVNRPSDGFEREVANALAVLSLAPVSELEALVLVPGTVHALSGSQVAFHVKGHDRYWNAVPVRSEHLRWSLQGPIGSITASGVWTAGSAAASGQVIVRYGDVVQSVRISVADHVASITLVPAAAIVEQGGTQLFQVKATDRQGREVIVSNDCFAWSSDDGIGEIDVTGMLQAGHESSEGLVTACWGRICASAVVQVGKKHLTIADFEKLDHLAISEDNAVPGSVSLNRAPRPAPVRFGTFAGKFAYDFTDTRGISQAHIAILNETGEPGRLIEGKPYRFGLWVYGDGSGHSLRMGIQDVNGFKGILKFTDSRGVWWKGWRYVSADLSPATKMPVRVHALSVVEINDDNKKIGLLYLDHFRAEYMDIHEDVDGPEFFDMSPGMDEIVTDACPIIRVAVTDSQSGVDPSSFRVWLNDQVVSHRYDAERKTIEYRPPQPLAAGNYRVVVEAADKMRNAASPPAIWSFMVDPQQPQIYK